MRIFPDFDCENLLGHRVSRHQFPVDRLEYNMLLLFNSPALYMR